MSSVLVTGGAGFIGSNLCERLLDCEYEVISLDNFNTAYSPLIKKQNIIKAESNPHYLSIEGDILDTGLLTELFNSFPIDTVVHLAALAGVRKSISNPLEYVDVDIKGTVNVLELSARNKVKKFIFASSSSVYGRGPRPFSEQHTADLQLSPYAASKASGESFCKTYNALYGIPIACLRFFTVYGPRQRPEMAIHKFTRLIHDGRHIEIFGDGSSSRDYTYIDDITDGIISAIKFNCNFEIFNLGSSSPVSLNQLTDIIGKSLGKPVYRRYMPYSPCDARHTLADISKARALVGYNPKTGIYEGITKFTEWYSSII